MNQGRGRGYFSKRCSSQKVSLNTPANTSSYITSVQNENIQPIKVSYNDSNKITINLHISSETEEWLAGLKQKWTYLKTCPATENMIYNRFNASLNPYEEALRLMYNCVDFKHSKPKSLAKLIMDTFDKWLKLHKDEVEHLLTQDIKYSAFNIVRQQNLFSLMELVTKIYELVADCDIFVDIITNMISSKEYTKVCQSTGLLGLYNRFSIHEFLVPLVLQDRLEPVENFLVHSKRLQIELLTFLDDLLGQDTSIRLALDSYIVNKEIPLVRLEKLHHKPLKKLITRLKKIYDLPNEVTPWLIKKQNEGAMQFLLRRRYVENAIGDESFREMVHEAVQNDSNLQQELVNEITYFGDLSGSLYIAQYYKLPKDTWPSAIQTYYDNGGKNQGNSTLHEPEDWNLGPAANYYKLKLSTRLIHIIDRPSLFEEFLANGLENVNLVGIDCEWKPSFISQKNELALMQIATRHNIFIIDVIEIGRDKVPHLWHKLGNICFNNNNILKLGFGFTADISIIKQSLPYINTNFKESFLDVLHLWRQIEKNGTVKFPFDIESKGPSLTNLVHLCLGSPLDKANQFSNWEKRPLRLSQIEYAALDAYCLIEIYDALKDCCQHSSFAFDEVSCNLMTSSKTSLKHSKKYKSNKAMSSQAKNIAQPPSPFTTISSKDAKFVCDTMCYGLGKRLRKYGIDTIVLEDYEDHMTCVKYYQNEKRFILTRGQTFNKLNGYVIPGYCLKILSDNIDEQTQEVIDFYKIIIRKEDVFSRCQICNYNKFVTVSRKTMQCLANIANKQNRQNPLPAEVFDVSNEYSHDATGFSSDDDYDDYEQPAVSVTRADVHTWNFTSNSNINLQACQTRMGTKIQIEAVHSDIIAKYDNFYICEQCGKIYWDGSHFDKFVSNNLESLKLS